VGRRKERGCYARGDDQPNIELVQAFSGHFFREGAEKGRPHLSRAMAIVVPPIVKKIC